MGAAELDAAIAADTPWADWKNNETSGTTLADSSGNARPMTLTSAAGPQALLNQPGPTSWMPSVEYANSSTANNYAVTTATITSTTRTIETWVFLPSTGTALASRMFLVGGNNAWDSQPSTLLLGVDIGDFLIVSTDGGTTVGPSFVVSPTALARDMWYHVVASVGAAGLKLRVDKVTVASGAATSIAATAMPVFQRGRRNATGSTTDWRQESQVRLGRTTVYATQLSDARTDAHFDAAWEGEALPIDVAATRVETLTDAEKVRAASTRLGVLLLEYVPIHVAAIRISAVADGSPWIRVGGTHVEVLIQEMPGLRTVPGIPVHVKRPDGRWEWPWHHYGEDPPP